MSTKTWFHKIEKRLRQFFLEFEKVCISSNRTTGDVRILFATKYLNPEQFVIFIHILKHFGKQIFLGENRVQEAVDKLNFINEKDSELRKTFRYVMIGPLQKNKINKAIELFDEIHAVDSVEIALSIDHRLEVMGKKMPAYLEVNITGEESKHGVRPENIEETVKAFQSLKSLQLEGLMTMAPFYDNPKDTKPVFRSLRRLADKYNLKTSMGMSHDWKEAVEEGTDMIRIGSRVFV